MNPSARCSCRPAVAASFDEVVISLRQFDGYNARDVRKSNCVFTFMMNGGKRHRKTLFYHFDDEFIVKWPS